MTTSKLSARAASAKRRQQELAFESFRSTFRAQLRAGNLSELLTIVEEEISELADDAGNAAWDIEENEGLEKRAERFKDAENELGEIAEAIADTDDISEATVKACQELGD
jgi:hypothetical protein